MNRKRDLIQIEEAYAAVAGNPPGKAAAKQQLKPGKAIDKTYAAASKGIKNIPVGNDASTQGFVHDNSGPKGADNFKSTELDPDNPAIGDDNAFDIKQSSDEGADTYFKAENKKIAKENINNSMAKNKSIFDRLYEEVMDDEQFDAVELGIGDDEGGDDVEMGGDEVTITIDKDLAQKLHDVLMDVLDGGEGGDDEADMEPEGDLGDEDEQAAGGFEEMEEDDADEDEEADEDEMEDEDEETFNYFGEEIEAEDLGHPLVNQKKGNPEKPSGKNNVVKSAHTSNVGSKGGDGKVTDKVGNDGDEGTPITGMRKGHPTSPKGSANVVKSKIKGGNQEFFQRNG
jgi:hypothetical protein